MVSLLSLVPLLFTLIAGLGLLLFAIRKKSMAQSLCVRAGLQMQTQLSHTLTDLLKMNPKAQALRKRRALADRQLQLAMLSGIPKAIALAQAAQKAVILEQLQLRTRQELKFSEAARIRIRHARELRSDLRVLQVKRMDSKLAYPRALAVRATPLTSLSPDYDPVPDFTKAQEHRFRFQVNLAPDLKLPMSMEGYQQIIECSISLREEAHQWKPRILAASAQRSY